MFGGPTFGDDINLLKKIEESDPYFVMLSDVWLDQPKVFEKLRMMFEGNFTPHKGYSQASIVPLLFLMIGNFQSTSYQNTGKAAKAYKGFYDFKFRIL